MRSFRKILILSLFGILFFILLLPYLLSVPPFKNFLIGKIREKTSAQIEIDKIRFSWLGPQSIQDIHISNQYLNGYIEQVLLKTPFWKIAAQPYSLLVTNGSFQVHAADKTKGSIEQLHIVIDGTNVHATGVTSSENKQGSFTVQGTAVTSEQFDLAFSADAMPTDPLDCLLGLKGDLNSLLGSSFEIRGSIANQFDHGSIIFDLHSLYSKASVQATFTPTSITLNTPLLASGPLPISLRKELAKKGLSIKEPISVQVANDSFYLSRPFSLDKLQVSKAMINLGRIAVPKPAKFNTIANFLKAPQLSNPEELDIWLTPIDFSLRNNLLTVERFDALLAQSIHLCGWGKINLSTEQLTLILGIPAETLAQTGLLSSAASDYVVHVPISGTMKDPKFDTSTATVQMAAAIASEQSQKAGGSLGLIGDLVGQTVNKIIQSEPTPPQKHELPWQK